MRSVQNVAEEIRASLLLWYRSHKRDLPWRTEGTTPYHVLVSELMLQQTQVSTVIPYYRRWLDRFPNVATLAAADEAEVLKLWQGLGYYRRARFLLEAAKEIANRFQGEVPANLGDLLSLPGIGRYTAGAVRSIGHKLPAPILDGNVTRLLCRLHGMGDDPTLPKSQERLWRWAEELVPNVSSPSDDVADLSSGLMELGATVCKPSQPMCGSCPLRKSCIAASSGTVDKIPPPKRRKTPGKEFRAVFAICRSKTILVGPVADAGRWAGLYELPTAVCDEIGTQSQQRLIPSPPMGLKLRDIRYAGSLGHTLTHRKYTFYVYTAKLDGRQTVDGFRFVDVRQLSKTGGGIPVSRATEKILEMLAIQSGSLFS